MTRNTKLSAIAITLASLALGLSGCAGPAKVTKSAEQAAGSSSLSGKVTETMDAGGYTYICLEKDGKKTWAALPVTKVTVGQEIKILGGAEMPQFTSKALNRTFDKIIFSGGLDQGTAPAAASAKNETAGKAPEKAILAGKVVETMDAGSYTYILLEKDGKKGWAAVPNTEVKVGEEIELIKGIDMGSFKSTTLNRTFDTIHFSAGVKGGKAKAAALPQGHPKTDGTAQAPAAPAAPAVAAAPITGKVVETMNAGGYTYACLEKGNVKTWAAFPSAKVSVGQELALAPGSVMNNFVSKSLNRTFDKIVFTNRPEAK
ncbi:MAG TPA: hypothetical protein VIK40_06805 [Geomonas sp.]